MDVTYAAALMRAWVRRRTEKGIAVNADAIWAHISAKWPDAEEWQREAVFQAIR
jgi:hypothetical protein